MGCAFEDVVAALGLEPGDLFADGSIGSARSEIVKTYSYVDETGQRVLHQTVRYAPKQFRQRRPDPTSPDGWAWNLNGTRRVLYGLPYLVAAQKHGHPVYVVEGEKDADKVIAAGQIATTCPMGAGKWRDEYS